MNLDKLRPRIERALKQPDALNITERVILSTLLYNNTYETAFKLRLSIAQVEQTTRDFFIKTQYKGK
jgi:hypothetical protein